MTTQTPAFDFAQAPAHDSAQAPAHGSAQAPKLRFPEFSDKWEVKKLGEITSKISDGLHSTPIYDEDGEYYFVNGNNLINGRIQFSENTKRVNYAEFIKHKKDLDNCTILISINGTIGSLALYNEEKIILGKSACYINIKHGTNKIFIYNSLQSSKIVNFFNSELTGSTIKNLSLTTIKNAEFSLPQLPEQTKIANFLTAIDEKIQALKQKKTLLEQYKKGIMQQIFSQELRFKRSLSDAAGVPVEGNDDGADFDDWEEKSLGEICKVQTGNKDTQNRVEDGIYPFFVRSNTVEKINTFSFDGEAILTSGDGVGVGKNFHYINGKFDFHQRVYCLNSFGSNVYGKYIFYVFAEKFAERVLKLSAKNSVDSVRMDMISLMKIQFPSLPEQQKIANFLTAIDEKIEKVSQQITATETYKKGLLQAMFC